MLMIFCPFALFISLAATPAAAAAVPWPLALRADQPGSSREPCDAFSSYPLQVPEGSDEPIVPAEEEGEEDNPALGTSELLVTTRGVTSRNLIDWLASTPRPSADPRAPRSPPTL
jgi:hypothetical protein